MKANRNAAAVSQTQVVTYSQAGYRNGWQSDRERAAAARRTPWGAIVAGIVVVLVVVIVAVVVL